MRRQGRAADQRLRFFFLMRVRPPRPTLFPYTTLFRSSRWPTAAARCPCPAPRGRGSGGSTQDRKSTRLNSSHSQTSYAVFCLKKKLRTNDYEAYCKPEWTGPDVTLTAPTTTLADVTLH